MQATAKNQFAGKITEVVVGPVTCTVTLLSDSGESVTGTVNRAIFDELDCKVGQEAVALIKASSILLHTDPDLKLSARNQLWGDVTRISDGAVNAEVTLTVPGGKTVCAIVTHQSVQRLKLAIGGRACAVFKASSVILCQYA